MRFLQTPQPIWFLALIFSFKVVASNEVSLESLHLGAIQTSEQAILKNFPSISNINQGLDAQGWTILVPSSDSRIVYVSSSSGDDRSGKVYGSNNFENYLSPGDIREFKSVEAAIKHIRPAHPDYLLLKRGESWLLNDPIVLRGGRSSSERMVLGSYGESTSRPKIDATGTAIKIFGSASSIAIVDLHLYAHNRDPASKTFLGWGEIPDSPGIRAYAKIGKIAQSILIENTIIEFFRTGIILTGGAAFRDIVVRRNVIANSYSERGHSQGFYSDNASILVEENLFDHNGWFKQKKTILPGKQQGQATKFNHNTYFANANETVMRNNIFLSPSSAHNKWTANSKDKTDSINSRNLVIRNNFYHGGEIGISAGGNTDRDTGPRWDNISIADNVMIAIGKDRPTNRTLGWYITIDDWASGYVCGNLLLKNQNKAVDNLLGIMVNGHSTDIVISHNTINGLKTNRSNRAAITLKRDLVKDLTIAFNSVQLFDSHMRILATDVNNNNKFGNNTYFTEASDDKWFKLGRNNLGYKSWEQEVMESNSNSENTDSNEPGRDFETYLKLKEISSIDKFVRKVMTRPIHSWPNDYTARSINDYLRPLYNRRQCPVN